MKITIFTPTYNRGYIISNLYKSLKRQTSKEFEWLVVDDGSTDNTIELLDHWRQEENDFVIRYFKKENGGKCSAINLGLELAEGELFFTVDSDDYLTDDAVEKILSWEASLPTGEQYCGIAGNLGVSSIETPNHIFCGSYYDGTALDRYGVIDGERAMVFYTNIHRKYTYPIFKGEKFMTEAVTWNRMARDGYKIRYYNDIIWIYEYKDDGLTKAGNKLFLNNPKGYGLWLRERAECLNHSCWKKIKMFYTFMCDLSGSYSLNEIAQCIGVPMILIKALALVRSIKNIKR